MKTAILIIAAALLAAPPMAAAQTPATKGAASVAEMLQIKQEKELRAKLLAQGRTDEVMQLDEKIAARQREQQEKLTMKVNDQLSKASSASLPLGAAAEDCDPEVLLKAKKLRSASKADATASF